MENSLGPIQIKIYSPTHSRRNSPLQSPLQSPRQSPRQSPLQSPRQSPLQSPLRSSRLRRHVRENKPNSPVRSRANSLSRSPARSRANSLPDSLRENSSSPHDFRHCHNPLQSYKNPEDTESDDHAVTFTEIVDELKTKYDYEETMTSTSLDILALYLKGHKILHMEAKTVCEKRLNTLMLPAILISSLCSILSLMLDSYSYGKFFVSALNTINSFLLALVSYLKLDGKAEAHKMSSHKYQKLEAMCEFSSGRVLFFKEKPTKIIEFVDEIQTKVMEIKDSNQFILPESIRYRFNEIFTTNVFSLVKEIQNDEIVVINDLKIIVQKMQQMRRIIRETKGELRVLEQNCYDQQLGIQDLKMTKNYRISEMLKKEPDKNTDDIKQMIHNEICIYEKRLVDVNNDIKEEEKNMVKMNADLILLETSKIDALTKAIQHRKKYLELSNTFDKELAVDRTNQINRIDICNWCKT